MVDQIVLKKWTQIRSWDNRKDYTAEGKYERNGKVELVGRIVDIREQVEDGQLKGHIITLDTGHNLSIRK